MENFIINGSVQFCKMDHICQNTFIDGWLEFTDVKLNKCAIIFNGNTSKSFQNWNIPIPLNEMKFWYEFVIDFLND